MMEPCAVGEPPKFDLTWEDSDIFKFPSEAPPPVLLQTPRLDGVSNICSGQFLTPPTNSSSKGEGEAYDGLLQAPEFAGIHRATISDDERTLLSQQVRTMQLILAEQKIELNRVAETFERRLVALCKPARAMVESPRTPPDTEAARVVDSADLQEHARASVSSAHADPNSQNIEGSGGRMTSVMSEKPGPVIQTEWSTNKSADASLTTIMMQTGSLLSRHTGHTCLGRFVQHIGFDTFSSAAIFLDAVITGVATDLAARSNDNERHEVFENIELGFLIWYCVELLIRFAGESYSFFYKRWNICDMSFVTLDLFAKVYTTVSAGSSPVDVRMLRMMRLLRAVRVLRLIRFLRELRMMIKCLFACSKTVVWVLLLMIMNVFIFAVYLVGQVSVALNEEKVKDRTSHDILERRFGTLTDACFSLFMSISGGISWQEYVDPLIAIHWTNGFVVFLFIFFTTFAMLNIITGVFVDGAVTAGRTDEEEVFNDIIAEEGETVRKLRQLFKCINQDGDDHLSSKEVEEQVAKPEVRILFKSLGIGVHHVRGLFELLDLDESGQVSVDEFITGCMRLKEGGVLDVSTLLYENKRMMRKIRRLSAETGEQYAALRREISSLFEHRL